MKSIKSNIGMKNFLPHLQINNNEGYEKITLAHSLLVGLTSKMSVKRNKLRQQNKGGCRLVNIKLMIFLLLHCPHIHTNTKRRTINT